VAGHLLSADNLARSVAKAPQMLRAAFISSNGFCQFAKY